MRKPPNYIPGEAVNGYWKQELLTWLGKEFDLEVLIETGTCDGGTLGGVYKHFNQCYSIELSDYYFKRASERFHGIPNVCLYIQRKGLCNKWYFRLLSYKLASRSRQNSLACVCINRTY